MASKDDGGSSLPPSMTADLGPQMTMGASLLPWRSLMVRELVEPRDPSRRVMPTETLVRGE
jgi:hypothetical protein